VSESRLSLLGGPFHRLGRSLGLVHGRSNTVPLGLAIAASLWVVLVALTLVEGLGHTVFAVDAIGAHVRLLLVIPLFFFCEKVLDPRLGTLIETTVRSGVVPLRSLPALQAEIARTRRWVDAWLPEFACLMLALAMLVAGPHLHLYGATSGLDPQRAAVQETLTGGWYWGICLTVLRFLMLRWLWHLLLWGRFLWRFSRLDLHLVPTHPDRNGGLGYLQEVHVKFVPLVLALGAIESASFAEEIAMGTLRFEALTTIIPFLMIVVAVLFLGPLLVFVPKLREARTKGLEAYGDLAMHYVEAFDRKWVLGERDAQERLVGSADVQSLADMQNSYQVVEDMRRSPVTPHLAMRLLGAVIVPMLPLLLFKFSIGDLSQLLFKHFVAL